MNTRRAALSFVAFLTLPLCAAAAPNKSPYGLLEEALGAKALQGLERQGLLATADNPDRLLAVSWDAFKKAEDAAPRLAEFLTAFDKLSDGREPADPTDAFSELRDLPEGGFFKGAMRDALSAAASRAAAVRELGERRAPLAKSGSLFRTPWGQEFAQRTHADLGGASADAAASDFFSRVLAAPAAPAGAAAHLLAWAAASGVEGLEAELGASRAAGKAGAALEARLGRYLRDQALLEQVLAASERLARIERGSDAKTLFKDARAAAPALAAAGGLSKRLKDAFEDEPANSPLRLSAHEVHVQGAGAPPLEPGDKAVFSAAYWVDGLPKGRSARIAEVLLLEDPQRGLSVVSRASRSRGNGGPYTVSIEAELPRSGNLSYRLLLDAGGAVPAELPRAVEVSDSLDGLRGAAAEAQWLGLSCRFDDAEKAWNGVLEKASSSKKASARVAAEARDALRTVAFWKARKKELDESLDGARLFASRERCEYRTDRAERALKLLAALPAGCDRTAPGGLGSGAGSVAAELSRLASVTESRRSLQEAFRAGVARAKDREASCKSEEAAVLYASSLALLDSDPDARCGDFEREHAAVRLADLPRAAAVKGLSDAVEAELSNARRRLAEGKPHAALAALQPLSTGLRALPDQRCWSSALSKADELAEASGVALGPQSAAERGLAPDMPRPALAEARRDWEERQARLREERGAVDDVQAPRAAGGEQ